MKKNVLCIIPARMASSRFPGKALCLIKGRPMIQWVYERVESTGYPVVLATDHPEIFKATEEFGGHAVMTSENHATGTDRIYEAATIFAANASSPPEIIINIQGDEPLVQPEQIRQLAEGFDCAKHEILTLALPVTRPIDEWAVPNKCHLVKDKNGRALYFSRYVMPFNRSGQQSVKFQHIGIYAYRFDVLKEYIALPPSPLEKNESLEQNRWLENGGSIHVLESAHSGICIDTPEDLQRLKDFLAANPGSEIF